ncbi:MAG: hypothetical protein AAFO82_25340, partial [Bacteroidota bacterium]
DSLGIMSVKEFTLAEGVAPIISGGRFGDYSQISVDPVDNTTFWFTGEYGGGGEFGTKTRIAAFELDRAARDLGIVDLEIPPLDSLTTNESITAFVANTGLNELADYKVGLRINGELIQEMTIAEVLLPDSISSHTFEGLDFLEKGDYEIEVFTSHPEDLKIGNNNSKATVRSIFNYDIALEVNVNGTICAASGNQLSINFENTGSQLLEQIVFALAINGIPVETVSWEGELPNGESTTFNTEFNLESLGTNNIEVKPLSLNSNPDAVAENSIADLEVTYDDQFEKVEFRLQADAFPDETTWVLLSNIGQELYEGGPYDPSLAESLIIESFCLDPQ